MHVYINKMKEYLCKLGICLRREFEGGKHLKYQVLLTENLGKIYLDFQRHVVRGIIDQKDKIR
jgi:hypothetical protein